MSGYQRFPDDGLERLVGQLADVKRRLAELERPSGTQIIQSRAQLIAMQDVLHASFNFGITGFTGWYSGSPASVALVPVTDQLEIGFGGALNGGDGYFCYSVADNVTGAVIINRATVLAAPAERVAVTGGASFAPSGWRSTVVTVPKQPLTVSCRPSSERTTA